MTARISCLAKCVEENFFAHSDASGVRKNDTLDLIFSWQRNKTVTFPNCTWYVRKVWGSTWIGSKKWNSVCVPAKIQIFRSFSKQMIERNPSDKKRPRTENKIIHLSLIPDIMHLTLTYCAWKWMECIESMTNMLTTALLLSYINSCDFQIAQKPQAFKRSVSSNTIRISFV